MIRIKRAYEKPSPADGKRVLIDGLWPRGVTKEALAIDRWLKEIAPSAELRRWFGHDPARWEEFQSRYASELATKRPLLDELRGLAREESLTLVYAAHDETHNNAVVVRDLLMRAPRRRARKRKAPAARSAAGAGTTRKTRAVSTRRAASRRARRSPRR